VRYEREGYLPVQRQIRVPWQDYVWLPDVVMIGLDPQVTSVDLTAAVPVQTARGSSVTDADGTRRATVLFPQGTQAELVLPDGTTQTLNTLNVRATEYTVGEDGPAAMPGELPPTSGYTYAVELSVDQALAAGAREVRFDRPVPFYVENFLDFPVGGAVPAAWYDRERAAWIPSDNGRIIQVLSVTAGLADLDIDGSGNPAGDTALAELGITEDERRELARLYGPGQSLWRTPVEHFTPWDCNWPYGPPEDGRPPEVPEPVPDNKEDDPDCREGSIIECQNQVLGESIPITGTPLRLHYRSDRVPGRRAAYTLDIPLSGATPPGSLKRIELEISVAGRRHVHSFPASPHRRHLFAWDGRDAYGRAVQGQQTALVRIGYVYPGTYYEPAAFPRNFALAGSGPITGSRERVEVTLWRESFVPLGPWDARAAGFGGWILGPHHAYDPLAAVLYLGDGRRRSARDLGEVIETVAGTGVRGFSGDGGPATEARLSSPTGVAIDPEGSFYIADGSYHRIRRVGPDGIIHTVAGMGFWGFGGDGGPAIWAHLAHPTGVAIGPEGSLYIADTSNHRIRRVGPDGIITTVAGTGSGDSGGFDGDGGPATAALLAMPTGVAIGPEGSLYIADGSNHRIRRVGPDGIIHTVAGTGFRGFDGDGGPATAARLNRHTGVAVGPDGSLYIADTGNQRIRRVGPDGIITTVAGTGSGGFDGDGGPATAARLSLPSGVAIGPEGSLYIAEEDNHRIRRVGPDGIITTVAGTGSGGFDGDGGPATAARLSWPRGVAIGPEGSLYIVDEGNRRIRRVAPRFGDAIGATLRVASKDGREHYVFDPTGRHLRTVDNVTGAARLHFHYDDQGYLAAIEDGDGNTTQIERTVPATRSPSPRPTASARSSRWTLTATSRPSPTRPARPTA
jgi:YD repeat-containing protein